MMNNPKIRQRHFAFVCRTGSFLISWVVCRVDQANEPEKSTQLIRLEPYAEGKTFWRENIALKIFFPARNVATWYLHLRLCALISVLSPPWLISNPISRTFRKHSTCGTCVGLFYDEWWCFSVCMGNNHVNRFKMALNLKHIRQTNSTMDVTVAKTSPIN